MTFMTDTHRVDQPVPSAEAGLSGFAPAPKRLRNVGGRAVTFEGEELGMAMSYTPELPYWFEINIYRASDGSFPVAIKQFFVSEDRRDIHRAWVAPTVDGAIDGIEQFDPAHDVPVPGGILQAELSAAEMEAVAMELHAKVADVRTHYRSLVGEFLHAIDA